MLRDRYGIDAPAADLFLADAYDHMMEDVVTGRYLGTEPIDGMPCHHLAFTGKDVDWQIWVEDGPRPLPRRYTITSKKVASQPEFSVMLSQWEPYALIAASNFTFRPPPGSTQIELRPIGPPRSARRGGTK
jgi:hypothetical protein